MNIGLLESKNDRRKTVINHILVWLLYLLMQFVWRYDTYSIYEITTAILQVSTWSILFYTLRLYLYPKYLWKNHWKLAFSFMLIYPIFQITTILYGDYLINLSGEKVQIPTLKYIRSGLFWLFNISFVAFGFTYYDELGKEKARRLLAEAEKRETELKLRDSQLENLKAQFNPHFLFNALWYIYLLVQETGSQNATKAVELLSQMMRYSMKNRQVNEMVPLEDELQYANDYIALQRLRTPQIKLDYQEKGNLIGVKILPLVLISFIENACKHGKMDEEKNPLRVHLTVTENNEIKFLVNNKISMMGKERSSGIGLDNVKNRLW